MGKMAFLLVMPFIALAIVPCSQHHTYYVAEIGFELLFLLLRWTFMV